MALRAACSRINKAGDTCCKGIPAPSFSASSPPPELLRSEGACARELGDSDIVGLGPFPGEVGLQVDDARAEHTRCLDNDVPVGQEHLDCAGGGSSAYKGASAVPAEVSSPDSYRDPS